MVGQRDRPWIARAAGVGSSIVGVIAMSFGVRYLWPDYVHTDYGLPLVWGTHVEDTIAGPVDRWQIDYANLAIDLAFWLGVVVVVTLMARYASWVRASRPVEPAALQR